MNFEVPSDIQTIVATRVAQRQKCNELSILCGPSMNIRPPNLVLEQKIIVKAEPWLKAHT